MLLITAFLKSLFLPPVNLIVIAAVGFAIRGRWEILGRRAAFAAAIGVLALSTPFMGNALLRLAQEENSSDNKGQAIVILAAGILADAPEYRGPTADALTLERLRFGASLQRHLALPVLVSGGTLAQDTPPSAVIMSNILKAEYGVPTKWTEGRSRTTAENAKLSAAILHEAGISRIYLVTHAWHMPRARLVFERQGMTVIAAGTGYCVSRPVRFSDFLPSVKSLLDSYYAIHELVGFAYYSLAE